MAGNPLLEDRWQKGMAVAKGSDDGCATSVGVAVVFLIMVIAAIPKEVWIFIGAVVGIAIVLGAVVKLTSWFHEVREEARVAEEARRVEQAAAEEAERKERARKEKQDRIDALGLNNAKLVEAAQSAVKQVTATEAARTGWLGDIDFSPDLQSITDCFAKAHSLRKVADQLTALDKPSVEDKRILNEAKKAVTDLERTAGERVELISKCATEARRIDESLRAERKDAKTAEKRAELHGTLSAMLYGIEAAPAASADDSAASAVMARVAAYRDIKSQIQRAREGGLG